ncbi:hypothetical protein [Dactylosporangium sp. NPDC000521]|uniref:hypothetical protein n=1 Tax=Dactylosporangium sp. NPDC000521 TaxID=3363975 RepID=UPI0036A475FF
MIDGVEAVTLVRRDDRVTLLALAADGTAQERHSLPTGHLPQEPATYLWWVRGGIVVALWHPGGGEYWRSTDGGASFAPLPWPAPDAVPEGAHPDGTITALELAPAGFEPNGRPGQWIQHWSGGAWHRLTPSTRFRAWAVDRTADGLVVSATAYDGQGRDIGPRVVELDGTGAVRAVHDPFSGAAPLSSRLRRLAGDHPSRWLAGGLIADRRPWLLSTLGPPERPGRWWFTVAEPGGHRILTLDDEAPCGSWRTGPRGFRIVTGLSAGAARVWDTDDAGHTWQHHDLPGEPARLRYAAPLGGDVVALGGETGVVRSTGGREPFRVWYRHPGGRLDCLATRPA